MGMGSANARRHCILILSLIGWNHTQNDPNLTTTKQKKAGTACVEHFIHFVTQYIRSKLESICSYSIVLMLLVRDWWINFNSKTYMYNQWSIFVTSRKKPLDFLGTWPQITKFMGPTQSPSGSCRPQMGPMLAPWTLLSGIHCLYDEVDATSSRIHVDQYRSHSNSWDICSLRGCFTNDYSLVIKIRRCIVTSASCWLTQYLYTQRCRDMSNNI